VAHVLLTHAKLAEHVAGAMDAGNELPSLRRQDARAHPARFNEIQVVYDVAVVVDDLALGHFQLAAEARQVLPAALDDLEQGLALVMGWERGMISEHGLDHLLPARRTSGRAR